MVLLWYTMVNYGTTAMCYDMVVPWYTMGYHGTPWYTMVYHGTLWYDHVITPQVVP